MQVRGKVTVVFPLETGTSKSGKEWKKQSFVLETDEMYPKKIHISMFGDKIQTLSVGQTVDASIDIESREYNGRWYTNVNAWKVEVLQPVAPNPSQASEMGKLEEDFMKQKGGDDLPF